MEGKGNNSSGPQVYSNNIESTIRQIDQGLLNIFDAREKGYAFIDFDALIKNLLSSDLATKYPATIKKYLSVFTDLNKEVGFTIITIIEINIKRKKYTVNKIDHRGAQYGIEARHTEEKQEIDIRPELIKYYKKNNDPKDANEIRYAITKFQHYTEAAKWDVDSILKTTFFLEDYENIFRYYGYSDPDKYFTFEKYIKYVNGLEDKGHSKPQSLEKVETKDKGSTESRTLQIDIPPEGIEAFNKCLSNFLTGDLFYKNEKVTFKKTANLLGHAFSLLYSKGYICNHDPDTLSQLISNRVFFIRSKKEISVASITIRDCFGRKSSISKSQRLVLKAIIDLPDLTTNTAKNTKSAQS